MNEKFEEFLNKKMFYGVEDISGKEWIMSHGGNPKAMESIKIIDLGEWAWEWIADRPSLLEYWRLRLYQHEDITLEKLIKEANYPWSGARTYNLFLAIAVACLGKREIEKRLKEAGK